MLYLFLIKFEQFLNKFYRCLYAIEYGHLTLIALKNKTLLKLYGYPLSIISLVI